MAAEVQLHDTPLMLPGAQDAVPLTERGGGVPRAQGSVPVAGANCPLEIEQREHVTASRISLHSYYENWRAKVEKKEVLLVG